MEIEEFLLLLDHTEHSVHQVVGMVFEVIEFMGGSYNSTNLAQKFRQILVG
jgi:hypothetical protein